MTTPRKVFKIKIIRTEADHAQALRRIDELMDALPGDDQFDDYVSRSGRSEDDVRRTLGSSLG